ncbi:C-C motif chemokine 2-like [Scomber scombrus]|uniref:C-C motif chemokine 2-like n=1 Tax=Scomber scombrus TaxID=13677 RepID=A0AAV1NSK8_SCOSC
MLLFLCAQVHPQCYTPLPRGPGHVAPSCCTAVSNATIHKPVNACYEQKEITFEGCRIHAYILASENKTWCVDPRAWWLPQRLRKLEKRKICCHVY